MSSPSTTTSERPRRRLGPRRLAFWLGVGLVGYVLASFLVAYRLTHRLGPPRAEPTPVVPWGELESLRLQAHDGESIGAWFAAGRDEAPCVLLLHGNSGSRGHCLGLAGLYAERGCSVLLISLRAHGDSTGDRNDLGLGARNDVIAAVEYLERRAPGRPVIIHGQSLGAAAAVFAAAELGGRARGYVLECPFRDLRTAVGNRTDEYLPPGLDLLAYGGLLAVAPVVLPELDRIAPVEAIGGIPAQVPVLILAGGRDVKARPAEAAALHERVRSHARLAIFEDAGHLDLLAVDPTRYAREIDDFLATLSPSAARHRGRSDHAR